MAFPENSEREGTEGAAEDGGRMSKRNRPGRKGQRAGKSQWGCRSGVLNELERDVHDVPLSRTDGTPRWALRNSPLWCGDWLSNEKREEDYPCNPSNAA